MTPANHQQHAREWKGALRHYYAMPYGERYVWGVTAGILRNMYERLYGMTRAFTEELLLFLSPSRCLRSGRAAPAYAAEMGSLGGPRPWLSRRADLRQPVARLHRPACAAQQGAYVPAHMENGRLRARPGGVTGASSSGRAPGASSRSPPSCGCRRPAARHPRTAPALGLLDGDGEEARVVGGAVRNACWACPRRRRRRHHGTPGRGDAARRRGRLPRPADRRRARHRHAAGRRQPPLRSRPCARTSPPTAAARS